MCNCFNMRMGNVYQKSTFYISGSKRLLISELKVQLVMHEWPWNKPVKGDWNIIVLNPKTHWWVKGWVTNSLTKPVLDSNIKPSVSHKHDCNPGTKVHFVEITKSVSTLCQINPLVIPFHQYFKLIAFWIYQSSILMDLVSKIMGKHHRQHNNTMCKQIALLGFWKRITN